MVTITQTTQRELSTPKDIAAYLTEMAEAPGKGFEHGAVVDLTSRAGIIGDMMMGDVGVVLFDSAATPFTWVLGLNSLGMTLPVQVPTASLRVRASA